ASTRVAKSARAEMALPVHASTPAVLAVRVTFVPSMRSDISPLVSAFSTCGQCKSIPRGMLSKHNRDTPDRKKLNSAFRRSSASFDQAEAAARQHSAVVHDPGGAGNVGAVHHADVDVLV